MTIPNRDERQPLQTYVYGPQDLSGAAIRLFSDKKQQPRRLSQAFKQQPITFTSKLALSVILANVAWPYVKPAVDYYDDPFLSTYAGFCVFVSLGCVATWCSYDYWSYVQLKKYASPSSQWVEAAFLTSALTLALFPALPGAVISWSFNHSLLMLTLSLVLDLTTGTAGVNRKLYEYGIDRQYHDYPALYRWRQQVLEQLTIVSHQSVVEPKLVPSMEENGTVYYLKEVLEQAKPIVWQRQQHVALYQGLQSVVVTPLSWLFPIAWQIVVGYLAFQAVLRSSGSTVLASLDVFLTVTPSYALEMVLVGSKIGSITTTIADSYLQGHLPEIRKRDVASEFLALAMTMLSFAMRTEVVNTTFSNPLVTVPLTSTLTVSTIFFKSEPVRRLWAKVFDYCLLTEDQFFQQSYLEDVAVLLKNSSPEWAERFLKTLLSDEEAPVLGGSVSYGTMYSSSYGSLPEDSLSEDSLPEDFSEGASFIEDDVWPNSARGTCG